MDPAPTASQAAVLHVVCFEEAGECALERIAREALPGDGVVVLGPESLASRIRALGLREGVSLESCGRVGGSRWLGLAERVRRTAAGFTDVVAHGRRARRLVPVARPVSEPALPPAVAPWSPERRSRVRRELGLAATDFAVLVGGDPSEWIDLSFASRAGAMAHVGGAPLRLVVSPRAPRIAEASRFFERAALGKPIIVDGRADRPWELLPALDGLIQDSDGSATQPVACAGWRPEAEVTPQPMSPLPALWAIACGRPACVHRTIDLGPHAGSALVDRFEDDVAELARALHARASSASAASR